MQSNHELLGMDLIHSCNESILTKLTCLVDYKGFRVVAYAEYREEALRQVFELRGDVPRLDDRVGKSLQSIGIVLNMKPHVVMLRDDRRVTIHVGSGVQVSLSHFKY